MRYVDYDKIKLNIDNLLKYNDVIIVLKDNAYGFGIENILDICVGSGINFFAVKSIDEGIKIKSKYDYVDVLVLGKTKDILKLKEYDLIGTINDYDEYVLYKENNVRAHLAIDVGMNRFGMKRGYLAIINDSLIEAIYTHIYKEDCMFEKINFIEDLANRYDKKLHIGGSVVFKKTRSVIRVGKIIYENTTKLYGNIVNIKYVGRGEGVGYDSLFIASNDVIVGVCDIGYVNGLNRFYNGDVFINGRYYPVIGKCCMDQCFILIDSLVNIGDDVEFYGDNISEDLFIMKNNMTKYELYLHIR